MIMKQVSIAAVAAILLAPHGSAEFFDPHERACDIGGENGYLGLVWNMSLEEARLAQPTLTGPAGAPILEATGQSEDPFVVGSPKIVLVFFEGGDLDLATTELGAITVEAEMMSHAQCRRTAIERVRYLAASCGAEYLGAVEEGVSATSIYVAESGTIIEIELLLPRDSNCTVRTRFLRPRTSLDIFNHSWELFQFER